MKGWNKSNTRKPKSKKTMYTGKFPHLSGNSAQRRKLRRAGRD